MANITGKLTDIAGESPRPAEFSVQIDGEHWEIEGDGYYMPGNGMDHLRELRVAISTAIGENNPRQTMVTRTIRVPADQWNDAIATAKERGNNLSEEIRKFLISYKESR